MKMKSIYTIVTNITSSKPSIASKVTMCCQNYAQFKLDSGELLTLRREDYRKVSNTLVLRNTDNKVIALGLKAITNILNN